MKLGITGRAVGETGDTCGAMVTRIGEVGILGPGWSDDRICGWSAWGLDM